MMKKLLTLKTIHFSLISVLSALILSSCSNNIDGLLLTSAPQTPPSSENGFFNNTVRDVHVRQDDKIIVVGDFTEYGAVPVGRFVRLNANGSLDSTCHFSKFNNIVMKVLELPDQSMIAVGVFTQYGSQAVQHIAKLKADCTLDTSFNNQPILDNYLLNIVPQGDKFLVGGIFSSYDGVVQGGLARIFSDGTVDPSFNSTGVGFDHAVHAIYVKDDLSILVGQAGTYYNGNMHGFLLKLDANGNVDNSFYSGQDASAGRRGLASGVLDILELPCLNIPPVDEQINQAYTACKRIVAVGAIAFYIDSQDSMTKFDGIASINSDGSVDTSFHIGYDGIIGSGYQIRYQAQTDKLLMVGALEEVYGTPTHGIARFNTNGELDHSFYTLLNQGFTNEGNASMMTYTLEFQSDGKMIVGGRFTHYDGNEAYNLVRLDQDGHMDYSFGL